jgi:multisubunit Na+/H+ antiporter MnhF subunit
VTAFVVAAIAMLTVLIPLGAVLCRARVMSAVVAYEAISSVAVLVLMLLAEGFGRPGEFELAAVLATLLLGSGLVFARFLERWHQ